MTLCNCPPRAIPRVNCVKTRDREFLRRDHCRCGSAIIITPFSKVGSVSKNIFKFCTLRWYQTWSQKSLVNNSIPGEMLILAEMPGWIWSYQWERLSFMNPGHLWNENCQDFKKNHHVSHCEWFTFHISEKPGFDWREWNGLPVHCLQHLL